MGRGMSSTVSHSHRVSLPEHRPPAGAQRLDLSITNTVLCRPPENRDPLPAELAACSTYLDDQLRLVRPHVVIALGVAPTERLLGKGTTIAGSRGRAHRVGDFLVVPTYHPSPLSINRTPQRRDQIRADFGLAAELVSAGR